MFEILDEEEIGMVFVRFDGLPFRPEEDVIRTFGLMLRTFGYISVGRVIQVLTSGVLTGGSISSVLYVEISGQIVCLLLVWSIIRYMLGMQAVH